MAKYDLSFHPPVMNAAGMLGFAPDLRRPVDWSSLGAFVTNPISLSRRTPAQERSCLDFPGGFLLHTGYPNPGFRAALRRYAARWGRSTLPVIVHLLAQGSAEISSFVQALERVEGVAGVELGLPPEVEKDAALDWLRLASGELATIVRVPLERALELAPALVEAGAAAVSLGARRGALPNPAGRLVEGRLYGPGIYPTALHTVHRLSRLGIPVIGAGGIYSQTQANAMLEAGAMAVQLDSVLWRGGY